MFNRKPKFKYLQKVTIVDDFYWWQWVVIAFKWAPHNKYTVKLNIDWSAREFFEDQLESDNNINSLITKDKNENIWPNEPSRENWTL